MLNKDIITIGLLGLISGAAIFGATVMPWISVVITVIYIAAMLKMAEVKKIEDNKK